MMKLMMNSGPLCADDGLMAGVGHHKKSCFRIFTYFNREIDILKIIIDRDVERNVFSCSFYLPFSIFIDQAHIDVQAMLSLQ